MDNPSFIAPVFDSGLSDDGAEGSVAGALTEQLAELQDRNGYLAESLEDVRRMLAFEDHGWMKVFGGTDGTEGLGLDDVKGASEDIRSLLVGGGLMKRGCDLTIGYVMSRGVNIEGTKSSSKRGAKSAAYRFFTDPVNQESVFSFSARGEMQRARFSDGVFLTICDNATKVVRRFPLSEVSDIRVDKDFPEEIIAYQRTWTPDTSKPEMVQKRWYYLNGYRGNRQSSITVGGETVPVAQGQVVIHKRFNRQVGWPLGIPDALAAIAVYKAYMEFVKYGKVVSESLARIVYRVINKSAKQSQNAAAKVAGATVHGGTATLGPDQDIQAINTAGKGYDFRSGDPLAALIASALNVSKTELLSDSAAAGSSYGAAAALAPSVTNAMRFEQEEWGEFYVELFDWATGSRVEVTWPPIVEPDPYRSVQALGLPWMWGLLHPDEIRPELLEALKITAKHDKAPEGVMIPNNVNSLPRDDVDTDASEVPTQAGSPTQGRANGTGGDPNAGSDLRTDNRVSEFMASMAEDRMRELVERFEAAVTRLDEK